jgi:hypothetical protein
VGRQEKTQRKNKRQLETGLADENLAEDLLLEIKTPANPRQTRYNLCGYRTSISTSLRSSLPSSAGIPSNRT